MKKILILAAALISSFFLNELILQCIIGFPTYGAKAKIIGISKYIHSSVVYRPYTTYWSTEAGNKIRRRNNVGLTGNDIRLCPSSKYIYVLGNSYIEATAMNNEDVATSVFQEMIKERDPDFQVVNLGMGGGDPHTLYLRSRYFSRFFPPRFIILVLNKEYDIFLNLEPRDFLLPPDFGREDRSKKNLVFNLLRNYSSFFQMLAQYIHSQSPAEEKVGEMNRALGVMAGKQIEEKKAKGLEMCIGFFRKQYEGRFLCMLVDAEVAVRKTAERYCLENHIPVISTEIFGRPGVAESGHYDVEGNKILGKIFYDSFQKTFF